MKKLRQEFADTCLEFGKTEKKLVVMVGDISHGILQPFAKSFPDRYYNIGICEPTIVNLAAGLSHVGLIPVVHTIAPFIIERAYEQIKLDFGYQKLGINLISVGGAFDYSQLGCSHHCYADVSLMSHFSNAKVFLPGSASEFKTLFKENFQNKSINYFKLTEYPHSIVIPPNEIKSGKAVTIKEGTDITIVTTGAQLKNCVEASSILLSKNISAEILYFPTIKPFDSKAFSSSIKKTTRWLSVEELSSHDGLFNLCLKAEKNEKVTSKQCKQLAISDFIYGYGSYEELCKVAGLTSKNIVDQSISLID